MRRLLVPVSFALALAAAPEARAAACCGTGPGLSDRLGPFEAWAVSLSMRGGVPSGGWDGRASFGTGGDGAEGALVASGRGRVLGDLELGLAIPFQAAHREAGGLTATRGGVGDVGAQLLYPLLKDESRLAVAASFTATAPTGTAAEDADPLGASATGLGTWSLAPALVLSHASSTWAASAGVDLALRLPYDAYGVTIARAPRLGVRALAGPVLPGGVTLALGVAHDREAAPSVDGVEAEGAARARTAGIAVGLVDLGSLWALTAELRSDLPFDGVGRNEPAGSSLTVGVRRAFLE